MILFCLLLSFQLSPLGASNQLLSNSSFLRCEDVPITLPVVQHSGWRSYYFFFDISDMIGSDMSARITV